MVTLYIVTLSTDSDVDYSATPVASALSYAEAVEKALAHAESKVPEYGALQVDREDPTDVRITLSDDEDDVVAFYTIEPLEVELPPVEIAIGVEGGIVQGVSASQRNVSVEVFDWDDARCDDNYLTDKGWDSREEVDAHFATLYPVY